MSEFIINGQSECDRITVRRRGECACIVSAISEKDAPFWEKPNKWEYLALLKVRGVQKTDTIAHKERQRES